MERLFVYEDHAFDAGQ